MHPFISLYPELRVKLASLLPGLVFSLVHPLKVSLCRGARFIVSDPDLTLNSGPGLCLLPPVLMWPFQIQPLGHQGLADFLGHLQILEKFFLLIISSFWLSILLYYSLTLLSKSSFWSLLFYLAIVTFIQKSTRYKCTLWCSFTMGTYYCQYRPFPGLQRLPFYLLQVTLRCDTAEVTTMVHNHTDDLTDIMLCKRGPR